MQPRDYAPDLAIPVKLLCENWFGPFAAPLKHATRDFGPEGARTARRANDN
jgi:hypothetical protein